MTWKQRSMDQAVGIGDDKAKGQRIKVGGLLKAVRETDTGRIYTLVQKDGDELDVWGSTAIDNQVRYDADIGKFMKFEFQGWGTSKRGMKFKEVAVYIWDGEPTSEMRKWPQYEEIQQHVRSGDRPSIDNGPPHTDDDAPPDDSDDPGYPPEDDLPF